MPEYIKTRLLLLSDTHASASASKTSRFQPYCHPFPQADVAIHTGDLTMNGTISQHEEAVGLLKRVHADLKIVIPGNHDLSLDTQYYAEHGHIYGPRPKYTAEQLQRIRQLYTGLEAQAANIVYLEEGIRTFQLKNGARLTIYASAYTPEFCNWAFAYPHKLDRFNNPDAENRVPEYQVNANTNVDVMLTHGPPFGILDRVEDRYRGGAFHVGCEHLYRAVERARPLLHCFGHIHEGWGGIRKTWSGESESTEQLSAPEIRTTCTPISVDADKVIWNMAMDVDATDVKRGCETLFVNSSIMNVEYAPDQWPWLVDLMLLKSASVQVGLLH